MSIKTVLEAARPQVDVQLASLEESIRISTMWQKQYITDLELLEASLVGVEYPSKESRLRRIDLDEGITECDYDIASIQREIKELNESWEEYEYEVRELLH